VLDPRRGAARGRGLGAQQRQQRMGLHPGQAPRRERRVQRRARGGRALEAQQRPRAARGDASTPARSAA